MGKLDANKIDEIVGEWKKLEKDMQDISSPLVEPQSGTIPHNPVVKNLYCKKCECKDCIKNGVKQWRYCEDIRKWLQKEKYKMVEQQPCYLYVTFRKHSGDAGDVDNLLKGFFDAIKEEKEKKEGYLLKDDKLVVGVRANLIKDDKEEPSISFALIPTYNMKILDVEQLETEEEMGQLNKLRNEYSEKIDTVWKRSMQMVTVEYAGFTGTFFDNRKNSLWSVESHGMKLLHRPEPGFDWESNKKVKRVMIYERSGCWWINKWVE